MGCNCGSRRTVSGRTTRTSSLVAAGTRYNILDKYGRIVDSSTSLVEASAKAREIGGRTQPA